MTDNNIQYKYPPIYKYGFVLLTVYMFLKHQKIMPKEKLLINSILITALFVLVDYIIIENHPKPFNDITTTVVKDSSQEGKYLFNDEFLDYELDDEEDPQIKVTVNRGKYPTSPNAEQR